jgi:hypothetical protein
MTITINRELRATQLDVDGREMNDVTFPAGQTITIHSGGEYDVLTGTQSGVFTIPEEVYTYRSFELNPEYATREAACAKALGPVFATDSPFSAAGASAKWAQ